MFAGWFRAAVLFNTLKWLAHDLCGSLSLAGRPAMSRKHKTRDLVCQVFAAYQINAKIRE